MKKGHLRLYAFYLFALSFSVNAAEPFLALGFFVSENSQHPLLALNFNADNHWEYPASVYESPLPENNLTGSAFVAAACQPPSCYAVGHYYDNDTNLRPLIASSQNSGLDWHYLVLPDLFGHFSNIACSKHRCFSVGYYENQPAYEYPLIAMGREEWTDAQQLIKQVLPEDFNDGRFEDLACKDKSCLVVGYYRNPENIFKPMVLRTEDEGEHWQYSIKPQEFPSQFISGFFYKLSCYDNFCISTGQYSDQNGEKPLLMFSDDFGVRWQPAKLPFPQDLISGSLSHASCNAEFCIALGSYENGYTTLPILFSTKDYGKSWAYAEPALPEGIEDGELTYSACGKDYCIAVGRYHDRIGSHPLVAVSSNQGQSWEYPKSATTSVPEADVGDGEFVHASCRENECIAVGNYLQDETYFPLLAWSKDKGKTWAFSSTITKKLPKDFVFGRFNGSH